MALEWTKLLCQDRRQPTGTIAQTADGDRPEELRTPAERDHDRILFSTPVRRLADKTQVFPLDRNDSVRTRLTHSIEVANLARSIGTALIYKSDVFKGVADSERNVPALLAATGLAHDLGNPPFGHQGENAIRSWFQEHFEKHEVDLSDFTPAMKQDFLQFEGNAQTIRLVTRLQLHRSGLGLNLTYGTLAAALKYPSPSDKIIKKGSQSRKKFGFFQSESDLLNEIWEKTGLKEGVRHPLTFIMEACDDIAYSVLDVEDAGKKGLISVPDLLDFLEHWPQQDPKAKTLEPEQKTVLDRVRLHSQNDYKVYRTKGLTPSELNDISMQLFRVHAIGEMVAAVCETFKKNIVSMLVSSYDSELISDSAAGGLCAALKFFAFKHAYKHRSVLEIELRGYHVLRGLLDIFLKSIERCTNLGSGKPKPTPYDEYVFSRISENYRRVFSDGNNTKPLRYRQYQLLTDMVAGMTDSYAMDLYQDLKARDG